MKFSSMLSTAGEWLRGEGPHHQVVISSRVRLARNLHNRAFPGWAKKAERTSILEQIRARVEALPEMQDSFSEGLQDLAALDKQRGGGESATDAQCDDQRRRSSPDAIHSFRSSVEAGIQAGR
jgi:hypothetical protein